MTKKFARHLVMARGLAMARASPYFGTQPTLVGPDAKRKQKMKKSAIVLGSVIILMSSVQLAAAAPKHHQARADRTAVQQQQRNADAFAYWPDARPYVYERSPAYTGGYSAPAGR
jgi:hypothetical protein